jgi:hypothetical protein
MGILKNCGIYMGGYDFSGDHNQISLTAKKETKEATTFRDSSDPDAGAKNYVLGLIDTTSSGQGYVNLADNGCDEIFFDKWGAASEPHTILPELRTAGEVAVFFNALKQAYSPGAQIGELLAFTLEAQGDKEPVNGTVLINGTVTATGNGTAFNLGAVAADEYLYAALHVLSVSGTDTPTVVAKVQSDNLEAFSDPTDKISFGAKTAIGSEWATRVAGPNTDTWWRINYTISGTNPSFQVLVVMGIQK